MSELDKKKAGLQKDISSVFKGVPVPQNNGSQQPFGTHTPDPAHGVPPKLVAADHQVSQSSLINKLNQSEDSLDNTPQKQTANVFPKPTSTNRMTQSPLIKKLPQPEESVKRAAKAMQPESSPFIEETGDGLWQQIKDKLFTPKPGSSPTKQKAMIIMVPILAIIMIFAFRQILSKPPRKTKGAGIEDAPVVVTNVDSSHEIDWKIPEAISVIPRDPIKLPGETDAQNAEQNETANKPKEEVIIVRAIVYSNDKPSALIGTKIVYVGDKVNDATIVKINRDSIEFEKDENRWVQKVHEVENIAVQKVDNPSGDQSEFQ
ncbi:MAG: hypothetical protein A2Z38_02055 [Planctomycetes bacterium RBG_19FT_COMBO_48_8]|nr:MAG: hypothetical protein A2Z38_02055 [Planctomycetes bacterium RBG_19FT_COMBO_48_8]